MTYPGNKRASMRLRLSVFCGGDRGRAEHIEYRRAAADSPDMAFINASSSDNLLPLLSVLQRWPRHRRSGLAF